MSDSYPFPHTYIRRDPTAVLLQCPSEDDVQATILGWLEAKGIMAWETDSGAKTLRGRAVGLAARKGASRMEIAMMNRGKTGAAKKGVSDLQGILPGGRTLLLEVKKPMWLMVSKATKGIIQRSAPGEPTTEQLKFLQEGHEHGALVAVVWSLLDVIELFRVHGLDRMDRRTEVVSPEEV